MTTFKHLFGAAVLVAATTAFGQTITTPFGDVLDQDGPGVIGRRYVSGGGALQLFTNSAASAGAGGVSVNMPLTKAVDVQASYGHSYMLHKEVKYNSNNFSAGAVWYNVIEKDIKPFIAGTLGYSFATAKFHGLKDDNDGGYWRITAGAEFPFKWVSVIPSLSYDDDFDGSGESIQDYVLGVEVNGWITPRIAGYVEINYVNAFHNYENSWVIGGGVRVKF